MLKLKALLLLFFLPTLLFAQQHYDIILKNGKIIDGAGNPWFYGDVGVSGNKITSIGDLSKDKADKTIDATGLIIAPGFIDVHTHIEGDEKKTPTADNFIYDGVTTVITGNCGTSNIDISKYFKFLDSLKLSINVGTLIGHNDVRSAVLGEGAVTPNAAQLQQMHDFIQEWPHSDCKSNTHTCIHTHAHTQTNRQTDRQKKSSLDLAPEGR